MDSTVVRTGAGRALRFYRQKDQRCVSLPGTGQSGVRQAHRP